MGRRKFVRALCAGGLGFGLLALNAAAAADLQLKAPPAPPLMPGLDVHGFFDLTFANDFITPRGNLVTNTGLTTQVLMGLGFDIYKNPVGFINDISFTMGTFNDIWSQQNDPGVGSWNEFDWFVDLDFKFAQFWKFGIEYGEFLPPAHDQPNSFPYTERYLQFALSFDDSQSGFPIAFHPYVKLFYETSGSSTVVFGDNGDTYDVELGVVPTLDLKKFWNLPVTLTAPTWFTVGPSAFWNSGVNTNYCGPLGPMNTSGPASSACAPSNFGVVSTGLTARVPIDAIIPPRFGNWYIKGGFQYYNILNDALLASQEGKGTAGSIPGPPGIGGYCSVFSAPPCAVSPNYASTHRDIVVGFVGTGFTF